MEDVLNSMLKQQRLLSNQLEMLSEHLAIMQLGVSLPQPINCDFCGGEHFNDSCHLYSMENSRWEQELHPYNQYEEKRLSNLENVLMQFMETSQASFKANQNTIQNPESW